jgi:hypothetical protein
MDIVLAHCQDLRVQHFSEYVRGSSGRSLVDSGFDFCLQRRKVDSIFIFDRKRAADECVSVRKMNLVVPINIWRTVISFYVELFEEVFSPRTDKSKTPFTLAGAIFGIVSSRLELSSCLSALKSHGLLPPALSKHKAEEHLVSPPL